MPPCTCAPPPLRVGSDQRAHVRERSSAHMTIDPRVQSYAFVLSLRVNISTNDAIKRRVYCRPHRDNSNSDCILCVQRGADSTNQSMYVHAIEYLRGGHDKVRKRYTLIYHSAICALRICDCVNDLSCWSTHCTWRSTTHASPFALTADCFLRALFVAHAR